MQIEAREEAQKQWNALACGELEGDKETLEYFLRVEADRYWQQPWCHEYFGYEGFKGKNVLEIGVGQGTDLAQFGKGGAVCHAIDITENHLNLARRNFSLRGLVADIRRADATRIPYPDNHFDVVYSFGVLHHAPELDEIMSEVYRVLRPGGLVMIALYHRWSAFTMCRLVLFDAILRGQIFRLGWDGIKATIEKGADGKKIKPYVRLYTKASTRKALKHFKVEDLSIHQFCVDHFFPVKKLLPAALARRLSMRPVPLESVFGWYVAAKGRKPNLPGSMPTPG